MTPDPQHTRATPAAPHRDCEGRPSDSAGQAWGGKRIPHSGFGGDTGAADPALLAALEEMAGTGGSDDTETELASAISAARWLVPIVAVPTEVAGAGASRSDVRSDMAVITLTSPEGSKGLPMFSSTEALQAWNAEARPAPVAAAQAAQAAIAEQCHVLLVDVGTPHQLVVPPSMLWALAQNRAWSPPHRDSHVRAAIADAVQSEPLVRGHRLERGTDSATRVVLAVTAGLTARQVSELATRVGERIAADAETRARIDALSFALETAP